MEKIHIEEYEGAEPSFKDSMALDRSGNNTRESKGDPYVDGNMGEIAGQVDLVSLSDTQFACVNNFRTRQIY